MARYTGPVCRLCRREQMKLYLKGAKCDTMKCPIERRPYPPGEHGRDRQRQGSEYLIQLREKQKARRIYGLLEKQFRNLYEEANRQQGVTGENLLRMLELRLDNVVVPRRLGAPAAPRPASSCATATSNVNGKRVDHPELPGAQGRRRRRSRDKAAAMIVVRHNLDTLDRQIAAVARDAATSGIQVTVRDLPLREHIDVPVREQLIVELYSK